jgi:hypothetical protein
MSAPAGRKHLSPGKHLTQRVFFGRNALPPACYEHMFIKKYTVLHNKSRLFLSGTRFLG